MEDVRELLNNSIMAREKMDINIDAKNIVKQWFEQIEKNKDSIKSINNIDVRNDNGIILDFDIINAMKERLLTIDDQYRKVISMQKDDTNHFIVGKQQDNLGTILLAYDNNVYTMIEFIAKCLLSRNSLIISSDNEFMKFTNETFVNLIHDVLKAYKCKEEFVQIYYTEDYSELLYNNTSINKVFACGNADFQKMIVSKSRVPVQCLGYDNYELYLDNNSNIDLVNKIIDSSNRVEIYVKDGVDIGDMNAIIVQDLDEAIAKINFSGSRFSTSIFTNSGADGAKFLREVKSSYIGVNSSPLKNIYDSVDINSLLTVKNMYYPSPLTEGFKAEF